MAPKGDSHLLMKVGREGFAMVDDFFGPRRVPPPPPHLPTTRPVSPPKNGTLTSLEAAEMYGGMVFIEYRKRKPAPFRKVYY